MCAGSGILLSLTLMPTYSRARELERAHKHRQRRTFPAPSRPLLGCAVVLPLSQAQLGQALASIALRPYSKIYP